MILGIFRLQESKYKKKDKLILPGISMIIYDSFRK